MKLILRRNASPDPVREVVRCMQFSAGLFSGLRAPSRAGGHSGGA